MNSLLMVRAGRRTGFRLFPSVPAETDDLARRVDQHAQAAAFLPAESRGIDEDGTQRARLEVEIELQFLIFVGGVGEGVDGAVYDLLLVVGRAVTLGFAKQFAGIAFFPMSDLLLAVRGD